MALCMHICASCRKNVGIMPSSFIFHFFLPPSFLHTLIVHSVHSVMPLVIRVMDSTMTWVKFNIGKILVTHPAGYQRQAVLFSPNKIVEIVHVFF